MTTFQFIVIVMFVMALVGQFVKAIEVESNALMALFGFEILAFAYLAHTLM